MILDTLAGSRFSYAAGVDGAVVVPAGCVVTGIAACCTVAGSFTIAPGGANHPAPPADGSSIPLPAVGWFSMRMLGELGTGTTITFTGTASYLVTYAKSTTGSAH